MIIEVVLSTVAKGRVIRKLWLYASQDVRTAATVGYSFANPPVADECELHVEAKKSCSRVTVAGQMKATGESASGFEQQVRVLETQ